MQRRCLDGIDVAVLAGGLGTRLRGVLGDRPKLLAPIGGITYLDCLLAWLARFGARRVVLSLGHLAGPVLAHVAHRPASGIEIVTLVEPAPCGTAGALRFIRHALRTDPVLLLNGDSYVDADLCGLIERHRMGAAEATLVATWVPDAGRYGALDLGPDGKVVAFAEKRPGAGPGHINAGAYALSRSFLDRVERAPGTSLERDVLAALAPGTLSALVGSYRFIDIGTPAELARAEPFFRSARLIDD